MHAGFTHQPVVVLKPLALEGRGFRALGAPDDVTGISDKAVHTETTSLRGRELASEYETRKWTDLLSSVLCGDTETDLLPATQLRGSRQSNAT